MNRSSASPEAMGAKMAEALSQLDSQHARASLGARRRLLAPAAPKRHWFAPTLVASLALVLVTVLAVSMSRRTAAPLTARWEDRTVDKDAFVASEVRAESLQFSDGSVMRLERGSGLRILTLGAHGAAVLLERGELHLSIVHRDKSQWQVLAGPYSVRVVGTVFQVQWDPEAARLSVHVTQGQVRVTGAELGVHDVPAGQRLVVRDGSSEVGVDVETSASSPPPSLPLGPSSSAVVAAEMPAQASSSTVASSARGVGRSVGVTPGHQVGGGARSWRHLAHRGQFSEALTVARSTGFDAECSTANAADLLLLGDVARYAGDPELSRRALLALRRRFPTDSRSAVAAFVLGKLAVEHFGDAAGAVFWFDRCLSEQPTGLLATDARGRRLEALHSLRDGRGRSAAREYLDRHPTGPHAALARRILAE